jgi:hypothetical protein
MLAAGFPLLRRKLERLGYSFDSTQQIDGRANHGKVKPISRTDVAVDRS